jgi:PAS domain S-box-containing protein
MRVFIIDDRQEDRESLKELLSAYDYEVAAVADGAAGIEYLKRCEADVVLLDIVMQDKAGIECLKDIKALNPDQDVILITAYATLERAVEGLREGAYDFLKKPFSREELFMSLDRIKQKRLTEKRLRESEAFLESVLNAIGEAVVVIDRDFRILKANKGYSEQTRFSLDEIAGRHCYEVSHHLSQPCDEVGEECAVRKAFEDGMHHSAVHRHKTKEDETIFVRTNAYPLADAAGNIYAVVETVEDITDMKRLEDEKERLKEQLIQSQKMEAIGNLAAGIAHDFNNMLTGISGFAELALAKAESEDMRKYLEHVVEMSDRAASLTNHILIIGRKAPVKKKLLDLNQFVKDSISSIKRMVEENTIMSVDYFESGLPVEADEGQLYQALLNLIINARDAMPGGGRILVKTGVDDKAGHVFFSVKDTGHGIPEDIRERIFEPFFSTKEMGRGTGLGLAIVYSIIQNHNGWIDVVSGKDIGAELKVFLPRSSAAVEQTVAAKEDKDAAEGNGKTILIVDDEKIVRGFLKELLSLHGYDAITAEDGYEAMDMFSRNPAGFDLIILDRIMPGLSGIEVMKRIKETRPGQKIILATGYAMPSELEESEKLCMKILFKPIKGADVLRVVKEALEQRQG